MIRGETRGERVVMTNQPQHTRCSLALHKNVLQLSVYSARSFAGPPPISTVWIQTFLFWALITPRGLTEMFNPFLLFIGWWVMWHGKKYFSASYCYINLVWNHRILSELCISFWRTHSKDFKNIYFIEIERAYRKLPYFFDFSGQNDQFRPRISEMVVLYIKLKPMSLKSL